VNEIVVVVEGGVVTGVFTDLQAHVILIDHDEDPTGEVYDMERRSLRELDPEVAAQIGVAAS